jgi:hypothetical protein
MLNATVGKHVNESFRFVSHSVVLGGEIGNPKDNCSM